MSELGRIPFGSCSCPSKYLNARGFPGGPVVKNLTCHCRRHRFLPWFGKIPWRRAWQPTPEFLPGESHGQRSLVGCSPQGRRVRHEWSNLTHTHESITERKSQQEHGASNGKVTFCSQWVDSPGTPETDWTKFWSLSSMWPGAGDWMWPSPGFPVHNRNDDISCSREFRRYMPGISWRFQNVCNHTCNTWDMYVNFPNCGSYWINLLS